MTSNNDDSLDGRCALVTGASRRIGATIVRRLHAAGARVGIHYRRTATEACALRDALNTGRPDSAAVFQADIADVGETTRLAGDFLAWAGRIDCLVNNASAFYPTPLGSISEADWDDLVGSNLKGPLFLTQAMAGELQAAGGSVVNLVDIHARRPLREHVVYGAAKAGLAMLTRSLAREMAPGVRVNGVAPGAIMWPEDGLDDKAKSAILRQVPLARAGDPGDIADCVLYLLRAPYVTGQIIAVDGGRSIGW
ncbi:MAG: pteridine reductase [Woeseiaceae bacterium]|nr:pteridine reductase [Woeseiaceae bacterium]